MLWINGQATEAAPTPAMAETASTMKSRRVGSVETDGVDGLGDEFMKRSQQIILLSRF